jgi:hypothetical protein
MKHGRTEKVERSVVYETVCDSCGKIAEGDSPQGWHHFDSHHGEWENDSIESYEYHDACSFACYLAIVKREFEPYADHPHKSLEIDDRDWWFVRDMVGT